MPRWAFIVGCIGALSVCAPGAALAQQRAFAIPSLPANRAIPRFAEQAGIQIVAPGSRLRAIRTRAINGRLEVRAALEAMLAGTGVRIVADTGNVITLAAPSATKQAAAATEGKPAAGRPPPVVAVAPGAGPPAGRTLPPRPPAGAEILVTGSHIPTDGNASPVPRTVIDARMIAALGLTSAADAVRLIPQNVASQSDATSGTSLSPNVGAQFVNLRGLNPTFGTRTLTLVNGRRFVPSSDGGQVDLNLIPSVAIARVETVTGGASAAYGSDAVAGVVNIILDDQLNGLKAQLDYGQTGRGDGRSVHAAAAYGVRLGTRGHLMLSGEYQRNRGIANCDAARAWCAEGWAVFTNEAAIEPGTLNVQPGTPANTSGYNVPGSSGYGLPNFVVGRNGGLVYNSPYGVIRNFVTAAGTSNSSFNGNFPAINPPASLVDKVFTPDGARLLDYDPGSFGPKLVGALAQGGDNASAYGDQYIQTPVTRYTTYLAGDYELLDGLRLFGELTYADRRASSRSFTAATRSTMPIRADNAFLPPAVAALLDGQAFSLGKDVDGDLDNRVEARAEVVRALAGLSGEFAPGWRWSAHYQYGENRRRSSVRYARHNDAFTMAIDAVRDPADPSRIICRPLAPDLLARFSAAYQAELRALYAACRPLNLFGAGHMDPAAIAFAWRPVSEDFRFRQHVLAAGMNGRFLEERAAGPVSVAGGIEYRAERGRVAHDGLDASNYAFSFGLDYAGRIEVVEGFLESNVPVFADTPLGRRLEANGAIRFTRNRSTDVVTSRSRAISATSWKLGAIYDPLDGLRVRASQSRDIRAAGFRELFQKTSPTEEGTAQGRVINPNIRGPNQADATPIYGGGNFALTPEKGDTTTVGVVLTPALVPGLRLAVDWYRIKLRDAIATLNGQRTVDLCLTLGLLCDRIAFATPTDIVRVDAGQANVGRIDVRGLDFEAGYRLPLGHVSAGLRGTLDLRFLLNHQYDFVLRPNATLPATNYAGQSGTVLEGGDFYPSPKWMWNAIASYKHPGFALTATVRHVGRGTLNVSLIGPEDPGYSPGLPNSISLNRVPSRTYLNLAFAVRLPVGGDGAAIGIFGAIENLFDVRPPVAPGGLMSTLASPYPTNSVFFDTFGARFRLGMRVQL